MGRGENWKKKPDENRNTSTYSEQRRGAGTVITALPSSVSARARVYVLRKIERATGSSSTGAITLGDALQAAKCLYR